MSADTRQKTEFCGCKIARDGTWQAPCPLHREQFAILTARALAEHAKRSGQLAPQAFEERP